MEYQDVSSMALKDYEMLEEDTPEERTLEEDMTVVRMLENNLKAEELLVVETKECYLAITH